ncbi:BON domain-containing protein [Micromonospora polyrhachis]|uniref:Osmotically-inducible protein OsmY n=1 Tax=Micromonospora polyrhachis TaxID=1282883 RepID=A0A7W7STW4_9ACTN|nr:BON domain-containing protein [Micromonospora polyrhachis]MBB4960824.1 osmotically-inducible protein OsmY [Micromonospora polyrhachis]
MSAQSVTRTDRDIQNDVLDELSWEPRIQPNEIGVSVTEGVVTLAGWVENYAKKWAAERAAHRVNRVRAVANDIEVRLPASAERSDTEIATAVTETLEWDAFVSIRELDVTVSHGWVTLRGEVEWEHQKRAAERAVCQLTAVRGVSNGIFVRPGDRPTPDDLTQRIKDALTRTAEADAEHIDIQVRDDVIMLSGTVRSWLEREVAERIAWSAPGIVDVHNHITVRL